jgi:hypothetical protein
MEFCQAVGLPTTSSNSQGLDQDSDGVGVGDGGSRRRHDRAIMKAAPISIAGDKIAQMTNPGRGEDWFVFGSQDWFTSNSDSDADADSEQRNNWDPKEGTMSTLQRAMMKMNVNNDPNEIELDDGIEMGGEGVWCDKGKSKNTKTNAKTRSDKDADPNEIELDDETDMLEGVVCDKGKTKTKTRTRSDKDGVVIFPSHIICDLIG